LHFKAISLHLQKIKDTMAVLPWLATIVQTVSGIETEHCQESEKMILFESLQRIYLRSKRQKNCEKKDTKQGFDNNGPLPCLDFGLGSAVHHF
jgi:hypothetical protein